MNNFPIGTYNSARLVNFGLGHWSADGGFGYTYFDPQHGNEFSFVTGFTYNWENPDTQLSRTASIWHLRLGHLAIPLEELHVGVVGYVYQQLTADSGAGATLGDFKSRVIAAGPQVGFIFPVGNMQGYLNLKAYWEF